MSRYRRLVPPPERVTWADGVRFVFGIIFMGLGAAILVRCLLAGIVTMPAMLTGLAFIAFGLYRVYVAVVRYRIFRNLHSDRSHYS